MSHFEVGDWLDYVRDIAGGAEAVEIGNHLRNGCTECAETYGWLKQVQVVARASEKVEVPERVVQRAKNLFEYPPIFNFASLFPWSAQLILDAGHINQPIGIRTGSTVNHALYEAGKFTIDLRQESSRGSSQISLVGQISNGGELQRPESSFPVALFAGGSILSSTVSNRFGEFSLTYTRRPKLTLTIAIVETGRRIDIPLTRTTRRANDL